MRRPTINHRLRKAQTTRRSRTADNIWNIITSSNVGIPEQPCIASFTDFWQSLRSWKSWDNEWTRSNNRILSARDAYYSQTAIDWKYLWNWHPCNWSESPNVGLYETEDEVGKDSLQNTGPSYFGYCENRYAMTGSLRSGRDAFSNISVIVPSWYGTNLLTMSWTKNKTIHISENKCGANRDIAL